MNLKGREKKEACSSLSSFLSYLSARLSRPSPLFPLLTTLLTDLLTTVLIALFIFSFLSELVSALSLSVCRGVLSASSRQAPYQARQVSEDCCCAHCERGW